MMKMLTTLCAVTCATATASSLDAQAFPESRLTITPRVGRFVPLRDLGTVAMGDHTLHLRMEGSLAYGVAGEVSLSSIPAGVRIALDWAYSTPVPVKARPCPERFSGCGTSLTGDFMQASADFLLRPLPREAFLAPYALVGVGLAFSDVGGISCMPAFDEENHLDCWVIGEFKGSYTDAAFRLGAGVDVRLRNAWFSVEATSSLSRFRPGAWRFGRDLGASTRNDLVWVAGLRLPVL